MSTLSQKLDPKNLFGFLKKQNSVLGIDIGSSSLKIIQVRREKERAILETYGELSTSAYGGGEVGRATIMADEKVSEMIVDLKKEAGVTASHGIVAIPLRYSFVTLITMPNLSDSELVEAIRYEARRYIPIQISDVVLEWWRLPIGEEEEKKLGGSIPILLTAIQREVIEKYRRIMDGAKIESLGFEIEAFSVARALIGRFKQAMLIIDVGALSTKLSIIDSRFVNSVHNVDRASQALSLAMSQSMGIDFKRAEIMKKEVGIVRRPEAQGIRHTILPLIESIFDEADRLRTNFRRKTGKVVDKTILCGGGSAMPGFLDYAVERLGMEVLLGNPFAQLEYPAFLQPTLKNITSSFTVAVGLTLKVLRGRV